MDFKKWQFIILIFLCSTFPPGFAAASHKETRNLLNPVKIVQDEDIHDSIVNLDDYLTGLMVKEDHGKAELKNSTVRDFSALDQYFASGGSVVKVGAICASCKILAGLVFLHVRQLNTSEMSIQQRLEYVCPFFKVATTPDVCTGLIERLLPTMYYVIKNRPPLKVEAFCGFTLQQMGCDHNDPYLDWNVDLKGIPKRVPGILVAKSPEKFQQQQQNNYQNSSKLVKSPSKLTSMTQFVSSLLSSGGTNKNETVGGSVRKSKRVKILQLTDLHIDPLYTANAEAHCENHVLCCRNDSKPGKMDVPTPAGHFADNHACDPPMSLLELTLKHLVKTHPDIEYFYMTGDIVPHTIHSSTRSDNTAPIVEASALIYKYYPSTLVVPMLGNHEPHPVNFFSPPEVPEEINTRWLYDVTFNSWKQWIPKGQTSNFRKEGFYAVEVSPSFKILAVNTNVCYGFNFWVMYNPRDPGDQLDWLIQELDKAEAKKQNVHIVGHVPPGHPDCDKTWSKNFYNIVSRYRTVVKGQFYGHTHYDELKVYFSPTNLGEAIGSLFISPSLTPYDTHNPSYKLFYADSKNFDIVDYETYIFDLEEANKTPDKDPQWFPLYRATTAYDIPDTRPENLAVLIQKLATNQTIYDRFFQYYHKALLRQKKDSTETFKRKEILCGIVRPYAQHQEECKRVQKLVDGMVINIPGRFLRLNNK